jgi:predicted membrane-bound spermidine synthase
MLFGFLIGLGAGAQGTRWLLQAGVSLPLTLAWLEFALAAVILSGVHLWARIPEYFAYFAYYPLAREFGAREVVRGLVCLVAMIPPAVAIGALFPLAIEAVARARAGSPIASLGRAAALNTLGNIAGVLLAGFVLLPGIGALRSVQLLAVLCLLLGLAAVGVSSLRRRVVAWLPAAVVLALLAAQPSSFDYSALASGANVYFAPQGYGNVIDHAESADGGLTTVGVVERPGEPRTLTLLTNGKFQGTDSEGGEMVAQVGLALAPLLHSPHRERALVIGFGTGVSARTLHAAGFRDLDIVDLSADILRLANAHFAKVNDRVLEKPGVHAHVTDGRNFLLLQDRAYDLVSMEITSIWFAGAASLYNREFYQLVKRRLQPHGVLQQWMQLHHLEPSDMLVILGTVRAEFAYVWLYDIGGQGIIVATNDPRAVPARSHIARIDAAPELGALLSSLGGSSRSLLQDRLLDPAATDRLLAGLGRPASYWISTDDNLHLEYSTPRGNVLDGQKSRDRNMELLLGAARAAAGK